MSNFIVELTRDSGLIEASIERFGESSANWSENVQKAFHQISLARSHNFRHFFLEGARKSFEESRMGKRELGLLSLPWPLGGSLVQVAIEWERVRENSLARNHSRLATIDVMTPGLIYRQSWHSTLPFISNEQTSFLCMGTRKESFSPSKPV